MNNSEFNLFSGGLTGAEAAFGEAAEKYNVKETNFSFEGHKLKRDKNVVILNDAELLRGQVSMEIVAETMGRRYHNAATIRKVIQVIFHMINHGHQIFAIGIIQQDKTVKGGTGWGVELGKFFHRPVHVFDQEQEKWFTWTDGDWKEDTPVISDKNFCGTGTRFLSESGQKAIDDLFARSFK
ncbi:MAG: hypothetical protein JXR91_04160 [Deltaproteobacteria bacterium]|nr:hypothetical protein [Deltaproteobacteria bacterium]